MFGIRNDKRGQNLVLAGMSLGFAFSTLVSLVALVGSERQVAVLAVSNALLLLGIVCWSVADYRQRRLVVEQVLEEAQKARP